MTNPWAPFLTQHTASHTSSIAPNQPTPNNANTLIPLSDYRIITLSGPDALKFLQGQCTCDFNQLAHNQWLRGAHCSPKGRMISSFTAARLAADVIGLRVHESIATLAIKALKKYLVFSKAQCELSELMAVGIDSITATKLNLPLQAKKASQSPFGLLLASPTYAEIWLTPQQLELLVTTLNPSNNSFPNPPSNSHFFTAPSVWQHIMISQGIAEVTLRTSEQFLPQAFNYDAIEAVSFKKGCYTGQEIIARVHYKGQSKQRVHILQIHQQATKGHQQAAKIHKQAAIGQSIINDQNTVVGEVINACGNLVLACSSGYLGDKTLYLAQNSGLDESSNPLKSSNPLPISTTPLMAQELPYTLA